MAIYRLFPSQDSTIYSAYPQMNAGLDSILEINNIKSLDGSSQVARSLIKFDQDEIDYVLSNLVSGSNFEASLRLYIAEVEGITQETKLEIYPMSGSWGNGNGQYLDTPLNSSGVSWFYQNYEQNILWNVDNTNQYVTSSYSGFNKGGGTWFTGSDDSSIHNILVTQSFNSRTYFDINANITDIVKAWALSNNIEGIYGSSYYGTGSYSFIKIDNEGLIIKLDSESEFNPSSSTQPSFKYYSVDTNTIYPPVLEIKWDDSLYETGSLPSLNTAEAYISLGNNPIKFHPDSINKFRVNARPNYPPRVYQTSSIYTNNYVLPEQSYYAIKDLDTNEMVIDFDDQYTKLSCDSKGNYFSLNMSGLETERNYVILIKSLIEGDTIIEDNNFIFKVLNG